MGTRRRVTAFLLFVMASLTHAAPPANQAAESRNESLKLLISVEQQSVTSPASARLILHLHNSGPGALWLYRHASSRNAMARIENARPAAEEEGGRQGNRSSGGSVLEIQLDPEGSPPSKQQENTMTRAQGEVLESTRLPHPKLVRLTPGSDYEEKAVVHLSPAARGSGADAKPLWGRYRLSVAYAAKYSNAEEINRVLALTVWQGEVQSNTLDLQLSAPPPSSQGSISGTVVGTEGHAIPRALVTLGDAQGRALDQTLSNTQGQFSFSHWPPGLYWITARRANSSTDTAVFRHVELTTGQNATSTDLVLLPAEIYEAKQMLHKPVLFRITNGAGEPAAGVSLEATWSSGTVLDNVKAETAEDGTAALELIPGRNFVTLKKKGCAKREERADVAEGDGVDGFKFALECR